mgnify:CR=1 FL=1
MLKRNEGGEVSVRDAVLGSCVPNYRDYNEGLLEKTASKANKVALKLAAFAQLLVDKGVINEEEVFQTLIGPRGGFYLG